MPVVISVHYQNVALKPEKERPAFNQPWRMGAAAYMVVKVPDLEHQKAVQEPVTGSMDSIPELRKKSGD